MGLYRINALRYSAPSSCGGTTGHGRVRVRYGVGEASSTVCTTWKASGSSPSERTTVECLLSAILTADAELRGDETGVPMPVREGTAWACSSRRNRRSALPHQHLGIETRAICGSAQDGICIEVLRAFIVWRHYGAWKSESPVRSG